MSMGVDGRLLVERDPEERAPLLLRLRRVEGQVRGLIEMVEADRWCGDELQQLAAARAALREVAVLLASSHVAAATAYAIENGDGEAVVRDVQAVLQRAFRQD
ncbi:MAG: metal-sensing transcriptional repressor [Gluconacetobacter diazotrophicus]|nr:metal-sensing transcriptional repressor [Gluconacetobacter diazotrophicus]